MADISPNYGNFKRDNDDVHQWMEWSTLFSEKQKETNMLLWGFISELRWKSMELENVWTIFFRFEPVKVVMRLCNQCGSSLCPFSAVLVHLEDDLEILVVIIWSYWYYLAVCQNLVPLVNIKIAGKWMFIPLKMVLIGIDPYPSGLYKIALQLHNNLQDHPSGRQPETPLASTPWRRIRPTSNPPSAHCFQPPAEVNIRWGRGWFWPQNAPNI